MRQTKDVLEDSFRKAGLVPEERVKVGDFDVFIGDGFIPPMSFWKFQWSFPGLLDQEEFPMGAFVTFWWVGKDEKLMNGRPLVFEPFHSAGYDPETKKKARLTAALKDAEGRIEAWKRNSLNG